ncbi:FAD-dependent oxidoreductase [Rhodococcus sp. NCIMB 12038]|uniref:FAD-dependent oxidoreductase n=1 Tax=Rhodococcus sp. NCIMB 12038 TaxID=933800 RepID=UPI000B3C7AE3|nr:FAD-dependent oxidoreductase [Rhodococcus sp. NCIMB 12038]OUS83533.1 ferredoxin [Rhodococcus sp. NCIMB 12038]
MVYVVTQPCCNDASCVEVCPVNCIHPTPDEAPFAVSEMLYIDAQTCIDCGACVDACPVDAITSGDELRPDQDPYLKMAENYYQRYPLESDVRTEPSRISISADSGSLRVAVVGSGPAACYAALDLTTRAGVEVNVIDRLPTPYGLVRAGVAPDHQQTKAVADIFRAGLGHKRARCWFNVEVGEHVSHEELLAHHHAVIYAVGAASARNLDIPGENLPGSHAATEFVAWYNGHPDYADLTFDFSGERAVIIGNGNVALDVARILVTDPEELAKTDIADHAIAALRESKIREVVVVGRRGPAQAAYTNPELLALGQIPNVDIVVEGLESALDSAGRALLDDRVVEPRIALKVEQVANFAKRPPTKGNKRIVLRFCSVPMELTGDGRVESITFDRAELVNANGRLEMQPTDFVERVPTGLVLRSVGYRGNPVPDLPFDDQRGIIPNEAGRVVDPVTGDPLVGVYTAGWIKRGPTGVIGTNKVCSEQTVDNLVQDFSAGRLTEPFADRDFGDLVSRRQPNYIDFRSWQRIDKQETARGCEARRPRVKFVAVADLLKASAAV